MLPALLGDFEKTFIIRGFAERCRTDGRELVNHRNFRLIISGKVIAHFSGMNLGSYEEKQPIRLSTQSTQQGSTIEVEDVTSTSSKRRSERFGNSVDISPLGGEIKKAKRHEISYEAVRRHYGDGDVGSYEEKPPSRLPHKVHNPVPLWRRKRLLPRPTKGDQNALDLRSLMKPCAAWPLVCVCTECPRQPRARSTLQHERIPDDQIRLRLVKQMGAGGTDPCFIPEMIDFALKIGRELHTTVNSRLEEIRKSDSSRAGSLSFHTGISIVDLSGCCTFKELVFVIAVSECTIIHQDAS
ncbi:hypothetical protein KIN20_008217 [Parelaphostrongylus tenuis]|uniref:Uncharacterized protein n=1 Tax=Parelaphostrongylus tenuis TaxID=148309 RepID=A0AAD5QJP0_PARTN|nr:hypothetical protein KIN20_008217 [Parelaphostrongylus tenuis]